MASQVMRITLKAYDHQLVDASAKKIIETVKKNGAQEQLKAEQRKEEIMRTREATYTDYGFKKGEEKQLKQYCLDLELPDKLLLLQCAHECNPMVEDDLFYSISKGVAFQVLARKGIDQNYKCHADVYGYKRKTLALFRSALQACGRYPF